MMSERPVADLMQRRLICDVTETRGDIRVEWEQPREMNDAATEFAEDTETIRKDDPPSVFSVNSVAEYFFLGGFSRPHNPGRLRYFGEGDPELRR